jgi:Ni/Co efflux regulator RcnB
MRPPVIAAAPAGRLCAEIAGRRAQALQTGRRSFRPPAPGSAPTQRPLFRPNTAPARFASGPPPSRFGETIRPPGPDRAPKGEAPTFRRRARRIPDGGPAVAPTLFSQSRTFTVHGITYPAFRARPYRYSRGYRYRLFREGERFPAFLLLAPYFITDYGLYDLAPPPSPAFVWVRFGPDALLVNIYTGEIVELVAGVFDEDSSSGYAQPPPPGDDGAPPAGAAAYPGPAGYPAPPP